MSVCILSCFLIFLLGFISSLPNLLGKKDLMLLLFVASLVGVEAGENEDFF
jgi:hypothetical protein